MPKLAESLNKQVTVKLAGLEKAINCQLIDLEEEGIWIASKALTEQIRSTFGQVVLQPDAYLKVFAATLALTGLFFQLRISRAKVWNSPSKPVQSTSWFAYRSLSRYSWGTVVFRHFVRPHLTLIGVRSIFHTLHHLGLQGIPFLQQFLHTLRIRGWMVGYPGKSPARPPRPSLRLGPERYRLHTLVLTRYSLFLW